MVIILNHSASDIHSVNHQVWTCVQLYGLKHNIKNKSFL